jgi:hypothetical protein
MRVLAELMAEDAEAAGGVPEASGGLSGGEVIDEESAKRFVLAVGGVLGLEENAREVGYFGLDTFKHITTISCIGPLSSPNL